MDRMNEHGTVVK